MVDAGEAVKESVKQLLLKPGMFFEELGLTYVGPIDGHDIAQVEGAVARARATDGPVIIHAVTKKGAGYEHAEEKPDAFHGIGPFSVETGKANGSGGPVSFTEAFAQALVAEAEHDERIVAITAAMPSGTGLDRFAERFPERFYDVGIAEEHAVGMAAGLALGRSPAGRGDLLDLPAAGIRPAHRGRRAARPSRGLLPGPCGPRG